MFGCEDQEWDELTLEAPVRPARLAAYSGHYLADLEGKEGLGALTAGKIDMDLYAAENSFTLGSKPIIKPFGVHGLTTDTGMGFNKMYDSNLPNPDSTVAEVCEDKYVMISTFPSLKNTDDITDGVLRFTAS